MRRLVPTPPVPVSSLAVLALAAFALGGCDGADPRSLTEPELDLAPVVAQAPSEQALMVKPTFHASLSGRDAGTGSQGTGEAWFRFSEDGTEVEFRLNVANITNVTMAHIHVAAAPGLNGPPAVWLYPAAPPPALMPGRFQGTLGSGVFGAANLVGPLLAGKTLADLRQALVEGRAYVNVHTTQFPAGEIRGTIR